MASAIKREVHLRGKIKSAMTYPIAVVGLVFLIMSAMLLFVVPQFKTIYSGLGFPLPLPTRALLAMSEAFRSGRLGVMDYYQLRNVQADTTMREAIARPGDGAK